MSSFHMIVGLVIVILYLALAIVGLFRIRGGGPFPWARGISFAAAGLLLLQYILGFALLADDSSISAAHYVLALLAVIPVGAEHMIAGSANDEGQKAKLSFAASVATFVLMLVVFGIGESSG